MDRRGFLGGLAGALAGSVLDLDKLLWVPGAKTISIPKVVPVPLYHPAYVMYDLIDVTSMEARLQFREYMAVVQQAGRSYIGKSELVGLLERKVVRP